MILGHKKTPNKRGTDIDMIVKILIIKKIS